MGHSLKCDWFINLIISDNYDDDDGSGGGGEGGGGDGDGGCGGGDCNYHGTVDDDGDYQGTACPTVEPVLLLKKERIFIVIGFI